MYERKIPVDLDCPLRLTMSLIDSKWKSCILDELRHRPLRPSELHRQLPEATPRVLDLQLRELVEDGLVAKTIYAELPPRSEYSLTELGASLLPLIDAMIAWGQSHADLFERKYGPRGYSPPPKVSPLPERVLPAPVSLFRTPLTVQGQPSASGLAAPRPGVSLPPATGWSGGFFRDRSS